MNPPSVLPEIFDGDRFHDDEAYPAQMLARLVDRIRSAAGIDSDLSGYFHLADLFHLCIPPNRG